MFQDLKDIRWGHWALIGGVVIAGAAGVYLLYQWKQVQNANAAAAANAAEQQSLGIPAAELPGEALSDNELEDGIDLGEGIGGSSLVPTIGQSVTTGVGTVTEPSSTSSGSSYTGSGSVTQPIGSSATVSVPMPTLSGYSGSIASSTEPLGSVTGGGGGFSLASSVSTLLPGGTLEELTTPEGQTISGIAGQGFTPVQVGNVGGTNNDILFQDTQVGPSSDVLWTQSTTDPTQFVDSGSPPPGVT
jgi:hypothetical protein